MALMARNDLTLVRGSVGSNEAEIAERTADGWDDIFTQAVSICMLSFLIASIGIPISQSETNAFFHAGPDERLNMASGISNNTEYRAANFF